MKCPKCGMENKCEEYYGGLSDKELVEFHYKCNCGYTEDYAYGVDLNDSPPTTAEQKLWWLIENNKICVSYGYIEMYRGEQNPLEFCWAQGRPAFKNGKYFETFEQAINAAYDWAKEQK